MGRVESILTDWTTHECSRTHVFWSLNDMLFTCGLLQHLLGYVAMLDDMLVGWIQCLNWAYLLGLLVFFFLRSTGLHILGLAQVCAFTYNPNWNNLSKSRVESSVIFLITIRTGWAQSFGFPPAYKKLMIWIFYFGLVILIHKDNFFLVEKIYFQVFHKGQ